MMLLTALALAAPPKPVENPGQMYAIGKAGPSIMPLERTSVVADVAGMGARVTVRQTFVNPSATPIEAVYKFPLPQDAAVDGMRVRIGERTVEGQIMRREAAKAAYEAAKAQGKTAALLDQETDNVFTQSVANVMPGRKIEVEITYVQILKFEDGEFELAYPMVVGPRYMGKGSNPNVATKTLPAGIRSGANVDLTVNLHGGAPIREFHSVLHTIQANRIDPKTVRIQLAKKDEIPNRDFVLRYRTAAQDVQEAAFTTWDAKTGGHFALVLAPPPDPSPAMRAPKEAIFVIDQSGSQSGFPIEKSKELSLALMDTMGPADTFNVMGFSNEVDPLWPNPKPNTPENRAEAREFIKGLQAVGGTQLEKAVVAALKPSADSERLRVVLFNTDGYAGQESTILSNVQKYRGSARLFSFGIGNSVNRALIDAMSLEGRGASEVVTLAETADRAKNRLAQRLEAPVLVNVAARFQGGDVADVTPAHLPDVFSARPVVVFGRFTKPGRTQLTLTGRTGAGPWRRTIDLDLPQKPADGSSVASLWARARLAEMKADGYTAQAMGGKPENGEAMTKLALDYRILSETTSFVAIDKAVANSSGKSTSVTVPLDTPDGVTMGIPGPGLVAQGVVPLSAAAPASSAVRRRIMTKGQSSGGFGGGIAGGRGGYAGADLADGSVRQDAAYDPAQNAFVTPSSGKHTVVMPKALLEAKGTLSLRVWIKDSTPEKLDALRKAGLKIGTDDGAGLVFGTTPASALRAIAKLEFVQRISPLR